MRILFCCIGLCVFVNFGFCQDEREENFDPQRFTDELIGYQDEEGDYEELYENLVQVLSSPYDLNTVSAEELKLLHLLSDEQIANFMAYREKQGTLLDVYELQVIPAFDPSVVGKLLPFVSVRDPLNGVNRSLLHRIFSVGHSYVVTRYERTLEQKRGFIKTPDQSRSYAGSPDKLYFRLRSAVAGDFSIGVTGEKDAGEKMGFDRRGHQWGFDFTSCHLQLQNKGKLKTLIVGDFQAQFGQGLLLGGAFGLGKGGESVSTTRKSNVGLLPYTSINETAYQRGAGFTLQALKTVSITSFYSRARRDATFRDDTDTVVAVSSFQRSGYHRTMLERSNRKNVTEQNYAVVIQFLKNKLDAGLILQGTRFEVPVRRKRTLYNQHAFSGTENFNAGFFLNYTTGNISIFSEMARSLHGGNALIAGILITPHPPFDVALVYRDYTPDFFSFYANAFSENGQPQNERGIYWGWKYRWNRQYSLTGYVDLFTFPWLGFRRYAPSHGYEWLLRGSYHPSKTAAIFLQLREESKDRNIPATGNLYAVGAGKKTNLSLHFDYGIGERIRLRSRVQYNHYDLDKKVAQGIAVLQDVSFSKGKFKFTGRHAVFDNDHHDNRHYIYENDVWLAYSLPAYSGAGVRNYALIEYKAHKKLTLWLRYARTRFIGREEIGSGADVIEGNARNDVKFQARFRF